MKLFRHISFTLVLLLAVVSCGRGPRVIPRGKMAKIYAEMLLTDQWINANPSVRRIADTSLVYEPVLEKYGYTSADYRLSVEHYMDDPERYSRILRTTVEIFDARLEELKLQKAELEKPPFVITANLSADDYFPFLRREAYVHYYDSLGVETDTMGVYRLVPVELSDTIYSGLEMTILVNPADSVVVSADTVAVSADTLAVKDKPELAVVDSLSLKDGAILDSGRKSMRDINLKRPELVEQ